MSRLLLFLCILSATTASFAQSKYIIKRASNPEANTLFVANPLDTTISKLAKNITRNAYTEAEKTKALFLWLVRNISYDYDLRFSASLQKKIYTSEDNVVSHVFKRKKALCGGYAFLFQRLCASVGIESKYIHGYTKTATNYSVPNHTWNAVKLNGKWHLLDVTWAASNSDNQVMISSWYLTNPKEFILSHFPVDERWALLNKASMRDEFMKFSKP